MRLYGKTFFTAEKPSRREKLIMMNYSFSKYILFASLFLVAINSKAFSQVKFAAIGDYGLAGPNELAVANLVKSWNPDFIITTGDNNYPAGKPTS